jgi:hypothetical protein
MHRALCLINPVGMVLTRTESDDFYLHWQSNERPRCRALAFFFFFSSFIEYISLREYNTLVGANICVYPGSLVCERFFRNWSYPGEISIVEENDKE